MMRARSTIAGLCEAIVGDPVAALQKKKADKALGSDAEPSKVEQLSALTLSSDLATSRLAVVSLAAVFLDVLPGYRLRLPTAAERAQRTTKDVGDLRRHESSLLHAYGSFVRGLSDAVAAKGDDTARGTAVLCLGQLFVGRPRFNLRDDVLRLLVTASDDSSADICAGAAKALADAAAQDKTGDVAVAVARAINKLVRDKKCRLRHDYAVRVLAGLRLVAVDDERRDDKLAHDALKHAMREVAKKKKRYKAGKAELLAETKVASRAVKEHAAVSDGVELRKLQRALVHDVALVYARILKAAVDDGDAQLQKAAAKLLPAALHGLAKIAHCINADVALDVLGLLRSLVKPPAPDGAAEVDRIKPHVVLRCASTALDALAGAGAEFKVDDRSFIIGLYDALVRFAASAFDNVADAVGGDARASGALLAVGCVAAVTLHRTEVVVARAAAFARRALLLAAHAPSADAAALVALTRAIFAKYGALDRMLDDDEACSLGGDFRCAAADPDAAAALATPAWELTVLARHCDPRVAAHAHKLMRATPTRPDDAPARVRDAVLRDAAPAPPEPAAPKKRRRGPDVKPADGKQNKKGHGKARPQKAAKLAK
ncbi:hypothetical protein M885DRAFT_545813 [Pelagophyceae sp. CCMP2097]|nr:hypothetical protein M885DRAFT_545813 [Pelagophyceae sp. CCMP2097]